MPTLTFDTSVFIKYKPAKFPAGFAMSAVVIQELAAGAADRSALKELDDARRLYEKAGRLLVPNGEDWWLAGKVLNSLWRGMKSKTGGRRQPIPKVEQQRIIRDVLIARSARRAGAAVVTENIADFEMISRFCKVNLIRGEDYFNPWVYF
jgi:predicted nucleic acid-binding protein